MIFKKVQSWVVCTCTPIPTIKDFVLSCGFSSFFLSFHTFLTPQLPEPSCDLLTWPSEIKVLNLKLMSIQCGINRITSENTQTHMKCVICVQYRQIWAEMHHGTCSDSLSTAWGSFFPPSDTHTQFHTSALMLFAPAEVWIHTQARGNKHRVISVVMRWRRTTQIPANQQNSWLSFSQTCWCFHRGPLSSAELTCVWELLLSQVTHARQCPLLAGGACAGVLITEELGYIFAGWHRSGWCVATDWAKVRILVKGVHF